MDVHSIDANLLDAVVRHMDAASAGFRVGYEDPSYFSREYKKHFGAPPHGDIANLHSRLET